MAPLVCHCAKDACGAPRPEMCIGRRYADGYRQVRQFGYYASIDGGKPMWFGTEAEAWRWVSGQGAAEWIVEPFLAKIKDGYTVKVNRIDKVDQ